MQSNGAGKSLPTGLERYPDDPNTYVFPSSNRILSHESSPQLAYQKKTTADKSPSINYCPNIKMLINDVSFLTHRAKDGDTVIYVGSTIGNYLPTLAKMFPCVQFLVYDGNPKSCHYRQSAQNPMEASPPNIHVKPTWFSDSEARNLISMVHPAKYDSAKTLLMVDTRNVTRLPLEVSDKDDHATVSSRTVVTDEDVQMDMRDQRDWVEILRPRAASLKFRMQISSSSRGNEDGKGAAAAASLQRLEYLDGTLSLQPFAHRASTEVRLFVDAKESRDDRSTKYSYPTRAYDSCVHDACMFHHNFVTRRQHLQSPARIKVSWDQRASHEVLNEWIERAMADETLSGISGVSVGLLPSEEHQARWEFVHEAMNEIDLAHGRTLGCRICSPLKAFVKSDNHMFRRDKVEAFLRRKAEKQQQQHQQAEAVVAGDGASSMSVQEDENCRKKTVP